MAPIRRAVVEGGGRAPTIRADELLDERLPYDLAQAVNEASR